MACTKGHRNNKTKKTRFIKKGDYIMGKPISLADMQQQIELRDVPVSDAGIYVR